MSSAKYDLIKVRGINTIYIGDRKLEPPEELDCPFCKVEFGSIHQLMRHVARCAENPNADCEPEIDLERP